MNDEKLEALNDFPGFLAFSRDPDVRKVASCREGKDEIWFAWVHQAAFSKPVAIRPPYNPYGKGPIEYTYRYEDMPEGDYLFGEFKRESSGYPDFSVWSDQDLQWCADGWPIPADWYRHAREALTHQRPMLGPHNPEEAAKWVMENLTEPEATLLLEVINWKPQP